MTTKNLSQGSEQVIKRGCLIKSPPTSFLNRGWKRREFKLCRSPDDIFTLNYYSWDGATEAKKGSINISEIQSITKGSACKEDLAATLKTCKCSPENVLVVRTDRRTYFLADEDPEEIEDWYNHLTESMERSQSNGKRDNFFIPISLISRPYTGPFSPHYDRHTIDCFGFDFNEPSLMLNRLSNPKTDLIPSSEPFHLYEDITPALPPKQKGGKVSNSAPSEPVTQNTVSPPKVIPQMKEEPLDFSDMSDSENIDSYMKMKSVIEKCQLEIKDKRDPECAERTKQAYVPQGGQSLKRESNELNKEDEPDDPQAKEVKVSRDELQQYLDVEQLGDCVCVCNWRGPKDTPCLFNYGDRIETMNSIRLKSQEFFLQLLKSATNNEVTLTITQNSNATILPASSCSST
ncbi:pleckstrin homology domain-containing family S member 1 isoform X3 [Xenopus laevis]|uniref:Pleckstrin homology domain-containing family S member 1 isoform X3 n=1 Tax=Xenopus laevis TaxID=8355 RepID=A0A8J0T938_XENLA|nr:pleckstrin homology domain-containing family S member 1 isoform X3 [Xenopus laevis]